MGELRMQELISGLQLIFKGALNDMSHALNLILQALQLHVAVIDRLLITDTY